MNAATLIAHNCDSTLFKIPIRHMQETNKVKMIGGQMGSLPDLYNSTAICSRISRWVGESRCAGLRVTGLGMPSLSRYRANAKMHGLPCGAILAATDPVQI